MSTKKPRQIRVILPSDIEAWLSRRYPRYPKGRAILNVLQEKYRSPGADSSEMLGGICRDFFVEIQRIISEESRITRERIDELDRKIESQGQTDIADRVAALESSDYSQDIDARAKEIEKEIDAAEARLTSRIDEIAIARRSTPSASKTNPLADLRAAFADIAEKKAPGTSTKKAHSPEEVLEKFEQHLRSETTSRATVEDIRARVHYLFDHPPKMGAQITSKEPIEVTAWHIWKIGHDHYSKIFMMLDRVIKSKPRSYQ